jgi:hypothetical protein
VHVQGAAHVIGRRVEHLEIGDGRVDPERVQGGVVPGQLENRQRLALGFGRRALEQDLAGARL